MPTRPIRCPRCDHDVTDLRVDDACPECGAPVRPGVASTPGRRAALMTALLMGVLAIPIALVVSGYIAIGLGGAGLIVTHAASTDARQSLTTPAYVLCGIGLALGLGAQIMMWYVMMRS